ncbi:MAG TPA: fibronectin type III domain-containing protein [Planctomycetota bacterium]|nr:fibronectin type III domain-containing protein [Planctomycetota bacterium]
MAEAKKAGTAQAFLAAHGEKLGLGVAAAALLGYLVLGVLMAQEDRAPSEVRREVERLSRERQNGDAQYDPPAPEPWAARAVEPWNNVIASARGANDFAATGLPEIRAKAIERPKVAVKEVKVPPVTLGPVDVGLDGVTISWDVKAFTRQEELALQKEFDLLKYSHFSVEREVAGSGKWEILADKLPPTTKNFKDTRIEPKTKYNYRVKAYVEPDKQGRKPREGDPVVLSLPSPVQTLGIFRVTFINPGRVPGQDAYQVWVKIEKHDRELGPVEIRQFQRPGEKIGWWPEGQGGEPTSMHPISRGGRAHTVDFNTGMTLVSIKPTTVTLEITKCKKQITAQGAGQCQFVKEKRVFHDIYEIVVSEGGAEQTLLIPNPKDSPRARDEFCEIHGGVRPAGGAPDKPEKAEAPQK